MGDNEPGISIRSAARALRDGSTSSVELVTQCHAAADRTDSELGTFISRFRESSLAAAQRVDSERARGIDLGPLHGIPIGVKDFLSTVEGPTTAQSRVLDRSFGAGRDAAAVARLRAAGAVIVGKTTTLEFGIGLTDATSEFPVPRNPWDRDRWAGGSSSGSANGLVAGSFLGAVGSDSGGSIRVPAAFCGVTGLAPTFGRVPTEGSVPVTYSLGRVGSMASTAWDCGAMLEVIGPSSLDPATESPNRDSTDLRGLRVGVLDDPSLWPSDADPSARLSFDAAVRTLGDLGASLQELAIPHYHDLRVAWEVIFASETFAYHAPDLRQRWSDYSPGARFAFGSGAFFSGADYVQAQRVRQVGVNALEKVFHQVDVIVQPTATIGAPRFDWIDTNGFSAVATHFHTHFWNVAGNPVLSVPIGWTHEGLPLGLQIAGRMFEDRMLIDVGVAFQAATHWHQNSPSASDQDHGLGKDRE